MSYNLDVGAKVDIDLSVGDDDDYTFTSSAPSVASVDADGIVTGVSSGLAVITIVRNSDGATVGKPLFNINAIPEGTLDVEITLVPVATTFSIDFSAIPSIAFVEWENANISLPVFLGSQFFLGIKQTGLGGGGLHLWLKLPTTTSGSVAIPTQSGLGGDDITDTWELCVIDTQRNPSASFGPTQAITGTLTSRGLNSLPYPLTNLNVEFDDNNELATLTWDVDINNMEWIDYIVYYNDGITIEQAVTPSIVNGHATTTIPWVGHPHGEYGFTVALYHFYNVDSGSNDAIGPSIFDTFIYS